MDAVTSFSHVVDSIPTWKEQVAQLLTYTSQKHEEYKAEYTRLVSKAQPKRMKSPSICSIHTNDGTEQKEQQVHTPQPPDLTDISPFEAGNRYIYAQATKKRKPGTSFRSGASGPVKFRSKQMVVIYYDSYAQEQFDSMVKSIGSSRNNLRKGKMTYTVSKGLQLPTLGRKYDPSSSVQGLDGIRSSSSYRSASKTSTPKDESSNTYDNIPTGETAFKQVDKELETCQNLCETAAHQFLRDGDCRLELDTVIQNLDQILEVARGALESFRAEEKKDDISTSSASVNSSTHTVSDATLVEKPSREVLNLNHKLGPLPEIGLKTERPPLSTVNSAPPMTTEIEVDDDSDQSSIEIDLGKFRGINNRAGLRAS